MDLRHQLRIPRVSLTTTTSIISSHRSQNQIKTNDFEQTSGESEPEYFYTDQRYSLRRNKNIHISPKKGGSDLGSDSTSSLNSDQSSKNVRKIISL